jgi:hypothetical protein
MQKFLSSRNHLTRIFQTYFGQECLDPPFSKGNFTAHCFNPSLEKEGKGRFWPERCGNHLTNFRYATLEEVHRESPANSL